MPFETLDELEFVAVPVFYRVVFACAEEMVPVSVGVVWDEGYLHYAVVVREEGFVTVAEIETPESDVFVGGAGDEEFGVVGYGHV